MDKESDNIAKIHEEKEKFNEYYYIWVPIYNENKDYSKHIVTVNKEIV